MTIRNTSYKIGGASGALAALVIATGAFMASAQAQDAPSPDAVARVGDTIITEKDLSEAANDFSDELDRVPGPRRRAVLVDVLVDMELLAEAAREKGLDKTPDFDQRLEFLKTRALRNEYVEKEIVNAVTDDEVKAEYDKQISGFKPEEEVHARHILVTTKEEAEEIIKQLDAGKDFAELAKEKSTGPSGPQGGDLGYFPKGRMVPEFDKAVFALEPGEYSKEPVKSEFGWHVIKLEDKRMSSPPPLDDIKEQLRGVLVRQKFNEVMTKLRDDTTIEVYNKANAEPAADGEAGSDEGASEEGASDEGAGEDGAPSDSDAGQNQ
ncbi:peptidylprolyl isomerase [Afifella sp. JA880]|uniref:peptidylprolyl isomerase n=1 Tax=Afifella sp. JA880 TaxID=2975280 RepID=UPI0021BB78DB|nr:peptidylprolyl isomerase [Afifella sp. JA880]MCT8268232.1 peptidylprolyl isomerase [Afifella sp. JA880]